MKGLIKLLMLSIFACFQMEAAAPATHVLFAQKWVETHREADQEILFVGTLFPDIRYLGTLKRNETHEKDLTVAIIEKSKNLFQAGMRIHAFGDVRREAFVKKSKIESSLKKIDSKSRVLFLKMLEDEILWDQIDTKKAYSIMQSIYNEELSFGVDESTVVDWHYEMTTYFKQRPSEFINLLASENKGFLQADAKTIKEWSKIFTTYAKDPNFIKYCKEMIDYVTKEF